MTLQKGLYEDTEAEWMRWCNREGTMLLTGKEAVEKENVQTLRVFKTLRD